MSQQLGQWGEALATRHYRGLGYTILDHNWHCQHGELDLVCSKGDELVFVEVKTRSTHAYGSPEEALSERQQLRIQKSAWTYMEQHDLLQSDWGIDLLAVERGRDGEIVRLERFRNAVQAQAFD